MIRRANSSSSSRGASRCRGATSSITYSKVVFGSAWKLGHDGALAVGSSLLSALIEVYALLAACLIACGRID